MKTDYANQNNRTESEVAFARNRKIDADEAALSALAAAGDKRAIAALASRASFLAGVTTTEAAAVVAADAQAASRSAGSVTSSIKAAAAAANEKNRIFNAAEKVRKAAVYQALQATLAAEKAAKLSA